MNLNLKNTGNFYTKLMQSKTKIPFHVRKYDSKYSNESMLVFYLSSILSWSLLFFVILLFTTFFNIACELVFINMPMAIVNHAQNLLWIQVWT